MTSVKSLSCDRVANRQASNSNSLPHLTHFTRTREPGAASAARRLQAGQRT